jgi:hypothetical protein
VKRDWKKNPLLFPVLAILSRSRNNRIPDMPNLKENFGYKDFTFRAKPGGTGVPPVQNKTQLTLAIS